MTGSVRSTAVMPGLDPGIHPLAKTTKSWTSAFGGHDGFVRLRRFPAAHKVRGDHLKSKKFLELFQ
jgi:hypothetical protein